MFANKTHVVDTVESLSADMCDRMTQYLSTQQVKALIEKPDSWSPEYQQFLLAAYCDLCRLTVLDYVFGSLTYPEPVVYMKPQKIHIFNTRILNPLFGAVQGSATIQATRLNDPRLRIRAIKKWRTGNSDTTSAKMPKSLVINTPSGEFNLGLGLGVNGEELDETDPEFKRRTLVPLAVFEKMVRLFVIADHGAWHYWSFEQGNSGNAFSDHHKLNKSWSLSHIVTSAPDGDVQRFVFECSNVTNKDNIIVETYLADNECSGSSVDDESDV